MHGFFKSRAMIKDCIKKMALFKASSTPAFIYAQSSVYLCYLMYFQSFTHPSILQLKLDSWGLEPIPATIKKKQVHSGQVANLLQG